VPRAEAPATSPAPAPSAEPLPEPSAEPPSPATPLPPSYLNAGGASCDARRAQLGFESPSEPFGVRVTEPSAFTNPVIDHGFSWCGGGSLRFDAAFDLGGRPNRDGALPFQVGEAVVRLPGPVDLRGKTVTVHFFVRGPAEAQFTARIVTMQAGRRLSTSYTAGLTAGGWRTVSSSFLDFPIGAVAGTTDGHEVDGLILKIEATGSHRVWSGVLYIDEIGWR